MTSIATRLQSLLRSIASEFLGLFIDDKAFALSILIWVAVVGLFAKTNHFSALLGPLLFAGLALLLLVSVLRFARKRG